VLDGVYLNRDSVAVFHEAAASTVEELEASSLPGSARHRR